MESIIFYLNLTAKLVLFTQGSYFMPGSPFLLWDWPSAEASF